MMETARQQAHAMGKMLQPYLDEGRKISPGGLLMLRFHVKHLRDDYAIVAMLAVRRQPLQLL